MLLAWTKIVLAEELVASDLPDDPYLQLDLMAYFPGPVRAAFEQQIGEHPLRREIIVTQVVNDLVNGAGMTFWPRLAGETGATAAELTNANFVGREIFGSLGSARRDQDLRQRPGRALQTRMRTEMRTLVERCSRWLVTNRRPPLDSQATVDFFRDRVQAVMAQLPELMSGRELESFESRRDALVGTGVPEELATRVAVLHPAYMLLARRRGLRPDGRRRRGGGAGALRAGRAARAAGAGQPHLRAAPRRPVADDGAGDAARRPLRRPRPAHRAGAADHGRTTTRPRPGSRPGRRPTRWSSRGRWPRSRRSAATTQPTWRGCRSGCAWCAGCWRADRWRPGGTGRRSRRPLRRIAEEQTTASAALERCLVAHDRDNAALNAITVLLADEARVEASQRDLVVAARKPLGPLHGVPIAIKEEIAVAGTVTTYGGLGNTTPATRDAEVVRRLRAAGAVIVGKTNMPEFGSVPYTESDAFGADPQPLGPDALAGRVEWRQRGRSGHRDGGGGDGRRRRRVDPDPGRLLRALRAQAPAGTGHHGAGAAPVVGAGRRPGR